MATTQTDDQTDDRFSRLADSFVDYLEEFLEAELSREERKTPPSSRKIDAAIRERLSEARYNISRLFVERRD